jgi:hypothetical protein
VLKSTPKPTTKQSKTVCIFIPNRFYFFKLCVCGNFQEVKIIFIYYIPYKLHCECQNGEFLPWLVNRYHFFCRGPIIKCIFSQNGSKVAKVKTADSRSDLSTGTHKNWLLKSEPDVFGISHLKQSHNQISCWDGVRNYQVSCCVIVTVTF